jgi:hypothetical protein
MSKKFTDHEIIDHGYEHSQYFQGCGTAFTRFSNVVTGCGYNAKEAYNDALEQVFMSTGAEKLNFPSRPKGINARNKVPADCMGEGSEVVYYVSIRWNE